MPSDLGIVFLHHDTDPVTRQNFAALRKWNPDAVILSVSTAKALSGGYGRENLPEFAAAEAQHGSTEWAHRCATDVALCAWYRHRREQAARWLLVEWDGFCAMPAREWLREVWDFPLAAPSVRWPSREPEWPWWRRCKRLPAEVQPFAVGIVPFCFILLADETLSVIAERLTPELSGLINKELRFPTLAHAAGFTPAAIPRADARITWIPHPVGTLIGPGMWHPVKWLVDVASESKSGQTEASGQRERASLREVSSDEDRTETRDGTFAAKPVHGSSMLGRNGSSVKISFCTAIRDRLWQFQQVFEANLQTVLSHPDVEWVILDYNSSDGLDEFIRQKLSTLPERVVYVRESSATGWHASVAKNLAHRNGRGEVLMNLDCDNLIKDAVEVIRSRFTGNVGALQQWGGSYDDGTFGRIAVDRQLFDKLGGYDESFFPMGHQDGDLLNRVKACGRTVLRLPCREDSAIRNDKRDSMKYCGILGITWKDMELANRFRSHRNVRQGRIIANLSERVPHGGKLSFCVVCMNQCRQLEQTLRENLETARKDADCEIVLVNYNCRDGLDEWVRSNLKGYVDEGLLKYVLCPDVKDFHASKAKNIAHLSAGGEWLFNLDADQFIDITHETIRAAFAYDASAVVWLWNKVEQSSTYGRIGMSKEAFLKLGGYDERLLPASYEDADLLQRAEVRGMPILHFPNAATKYLLTDLQETMARLSMEYREWPYERMREANEIISRKNLLLRRLHVNPDRGKVRTLVNWKHETCV
jgi:hypothetical protein